MIISVTYFMEGYMGDPNDSKPGKEEASLGWSELLDNAQKVIDKDLLESAFGETLPGKYAKAREEQGEYAADKQVLEYIRKEHPDIAEFFDKEPAGKLIKGMIKESDKMDDSPNSSLKYLAEKLGKSR